MNIIIDIIHPAHINLFKGAIKILEKQGHKVIVSCINRGKLSDIVKNELHPIPVKVIGKHRGSTFSILFEANLLRIFQLIGFIVGKKIDVGISFGSFLMGFVLTILRKPNIHLSDDPERKVNAVLELLTCTERYLPPIVKPKGKTRTFNALKEWAYLSPKYFKPHSKIVEDYGLNPKEYIFIREVSTGSLNYKGQKAGLVATFAHQLPKHLKVVLSLEDKSLINRYPSDWILLKEPVNDIHSLIYYSKLVISSGDSMAREGAMLGNLSIYCGSREMKANQLLVDRNMLFKIEPNQVASFVSDFIIGKIDVPSQDIFRDNLYEEWDDVTEFLIKTVLKYN